MINTYTLALAVQYSNQELKSVTIAKQVQVKKKSRRKNKTKPKTKRSEAMGERMPWRDKSSINIQEDYIMLCQDSGRKKKQQKQALTWRPANNLHLFSYIKQLLFTGVP